MEEAQLQTMEEKKPGYKKTKLGWIPEDWEIVKLGKIGKVVSGLTYTPSDVSTKGLLVLRSSNVQNRRITFEDNVFVREDIEKYNPVTKRDILICVRNGSKSLIGKSAIIGDDASGSAFGAFMSVYRSKYNKFIFQLFDTDIYHRSIQRNLGATINSINSKDLKRIEIPLPGEKERDALVKLFSTWDTSITKLNDLNNRKKSIQKGLMQQLLTGKKRLPGFSAEWKEVVLSSFLKYSPRPIDKPEQNYLALGLRSHGKGIFHKPNFDPKSIAMDTLYLVKNEDLVVNITFAWEHAIAIADEKDEGGLVSHRFPTYTIDKSKVAQTFLKFFILQPRFKYLLKLISPGGAGRNRVMNKKDFLKLRIQIPPLEEQIKIAKIMQSAEKEIELLKKKKELLQTQKKGLMQQLLTGKKRLTN